VDECKPLLAGIVFISFSLMDMYGVALVGRCSLTLLNPR